MVWPGISQTSIGEKNPNSLMINKRQLRRLSKFTLIQDFSWMRNPNKEQNLWWSKSKTRVVFNFFKKKMIPRPNFDLLYLLHQNLGWPKTTTTKGTEFKDDACDLHWHSTSPTRWRLDIVQLSWLVGRFASFEADGWVWYLTSPPKNSPFHQNFWYLHCSFKACFEVLNDGCFNGMIPKLLFKKHGSFIRTHLKQVV